MARASEPADGFVLWHNPHCSKSRAALELLRAHGIEPQLRDYRTDPPSAAELQEVARAVGSVRELLRADEPAAAELGLSPDSRDEALIAALSAHPRLIQRPILIRGDRAMVGRPPERLLSLVDG